MEINLDNPIFVYYFDAKNHPRSYIENTFYNFQFLIIFDPYMNLPAM
jgi:hypothetical protein